jgi:hypothetical protein
LARRNSASPRRSAVSFWLPFLNKSLSCLEVSVLIQT